MEPEVKIVEVKIVSDSRGVGGFFRRLRDSCFYLQLPNNQPFEELAPKVAADLRLRRQDTDGRPLHYALLRRGIQLDTFDTLASAKIPPKQKLTISSASSADITVKLPFSNLQSVRVSLAANRPIRDVIVTAREKGDLPDRPGSGFIGYVIFAKGVGILRGDIPISRSPLVSGGEVTLSRTARLIFADHTRQHKRTLEMPVDIPVATVAREVAEGLGLGVFDSSGKELSLYLAVPERGGCLPSDEMFSAAVLRGDESFVLERAISSMSILLEEPRAIGTTEKVEDILLDETTDELLNRVAGEDARSRGLFLFDLADCRRLPAGTTLQAAKVSSASRLAALSGLAVTITDSASGNSASAVLPASLPVGQLREALARQVELREPTGHKLFCEEIGRWLADSESPRAAQVPNDAHLRFEHVARFLLSGPGPGQPSEREVPVGIPVEALTLRLAQMLGEPIPSLEGRKFSYRVTSSSLNRELGAQESLSSATVPVGTELRLEKIKELDLNLVCPSQKSCQIRVRVDAKVSQVVSGLVKRLPDLVPEGSGLKPRLVLDRRGQLLWLDDYRTLEEQAVEDGATLYVRLSVEAHIIDLVRPLRMLSVCSGRLPADVPVKDLKPSVVTKFGLPLRDEDGQLIPYRLASLTTSFVDRLARGPVWLGEDDTVVAAGSMSGLVFLCLLVGSTIEESDFGSVPGQEQPA